MQRARSPFAAVALASLALAGCVGDIETPEPIAGDPELDTIYSHAPSWDAIRAERQADVDAYLAANPDGFEAFTTGALGVLGVPYSLYQQFQIVFPDIWGAPDQFLKPQGFSQNPFDPDAPLPLGLAIGQLPLPDGTTTPVVTLSCAGCHTGRVELEDGSTLALVGAPSTTFNQFRSAVEATVNDPRYDAIIAATEAQYGAAAAAGLIQFKEKVLLRRQLMAASLEAWTFNPHRDLAFPDIETPFAPPVNPPDLDDRNKPGHLDAIGVALVSLVAPEVIAGDFAFVASFMPPLPAQVDNMSVWNQGLRPTAQWDGSIPNPIYRNLAASIGVIGDPAAISYSNAAATADFNEQLPPPPYPFDVDMRDAAQGAVVYGVYCAQCHSTGRPELEAVFDAAYARAGVDRYPIDTVFPAADVGTDPNREHIITPQNRARLIAVLRASCVDASRCTVPDTEILRDVDGDATGRGYLAQPLDGIWARAPYLHNGSVPTLYHLLVPASRPETFIRGDIRYDQDYVGFAWDGTADAAQNHHVFDTRESGASNAGHDTAEYIGKDWTRTGRSRRQLRQLLEFLKTL